MATYCYRCTLCERSVNFPHRDARLCPVCAEATLVRDYRAESVQVSPAVLVSRPYTLPPPPPGLDD